MKNPFGELIRVYERMDRELEATQLTSVELSKLRQWARNAESMVDKWIGERHGGRCLDVESRHLFLKAMYAAMLAACAGDRYLDALAHGWPPEHRDPAGLRCPHSERYL